MAGGLRGDEHLDGESAATMSATNRKRQGKTAPSHIPVPVTPGMYRALRALASRGSVGQLAQRILAEYLRQYPIGRAIPEITKPKLEAAE